MGEAALINEVYQPKSPNGRNRHIRYRPVGEKQIPTQHRALLIERADKPNASRQWVNEPWFLENFELAAPEGETR